MRELFLHVGMHKTGMTSIQQTLHANRARLQRAGLSYFEAEEANHSRRVYSAFAEAPHLYHANRRHGLHRPEDAAAFAAESRDRLSAFLSGAPGPALILSGEDIGMLSPPGKRAMLEAFRPHVDRITVLGFVRPPRSFVASAVGQRIRGGAVEAELAQGVAPRYRDRFGDFLDAPDVAEVRLRPYDRAALPRGGCAVSGFLALCGAPPPLYDRMEVVRANTATSRLAALLGLAANEAVPVFLPSGAANPERTNRLARFLDRLEGPRFEPPAALVAPLLDRAREDIAWVEGVLGQAFPEEEKRGGGAEDDLRSLSWPEVQALARGLNALLREGEAARAARRAAGVPAAARKPGTKATAPGRRKAGEEAAAPAPRPPRPEDREALRAARRRQRRIGGEGRAWRG
jgi:hypothetical protein